MFISEKPPISESLSMSVAEAIMDPIVDQIQEQANSHISTISDLKAYVKLNARKWAHNKEEAQGILKVCIDMISKSRPESPNYGFTRTFSSRIDPKFS